MLAYLAVNKVNGKGYVGITTHSLDHRWKKHVNDSKRFKHLFAKAIAKYGDESFEIKQIASAIGTLTNLKELEKILICQYGTFVPNGYNLTKGGDGVFGYKPSQESIQKRLAKMQNYVHSDETKEKMSLAHLGDKNHFFGKSHSNETKKKISDSKKESPTKFWLGKQRSEETKRKISDALLNRVGHKHTEESRLKLSLAHKGKKQGSPSDETRKKLSEAIRKSWIVRKQKMNQGD